jgi:hypothetical protein
MMNFKAAPDTLAPFAPLKSSRISPPVVPVSDPVYTHNSPGGAEGELVKPSQIPAPPLGTMWTCSSFIPLASGMAKLIGV